MEMTALGDGNAYLTQVPLGEIQVSSTNPRKSFDSDGLDELTASIKELGVQVPLLVRKMFDPDDGELLSFELVAGERRLCAATRLGMETVPCLVREMTDEQARETQIVENLQRADVHPVEEALAYRSLIEAAAWPKDTNILAQDLKPEDVAKKVGKTAAYIAQRLRLLDLEETARLLFVENHITLKHALLLARLTPADQERAVRELLEGSGDYSKMSVAEVFAARKKNIATNSYSRHSRLVDMTEGELKEWISSQVMLKLKNAPWDLEDAKLVPAAGACTSCPKRSGSNAALFSDLTPDQDVCLDAACYGNKSRAFVVLSTQKAEAEGEPLLKLSAKSGHKKLPDPVTEKTVFRLGQWVAAKKGSCTATRRGILVDSSGIYAQTKYSSGDIVNVCVDQRCKEHKHTVEAVVKSGKGSTQPTESYEVRQKREKAEEDALRKKEEPILRAVYDAMLAKLTPAAMYLQSLILGEAQHSASLICKEMGIEYSKNAAVALKEFLAKATLEQLHRVAFHAILIKHLSPNGYWLRENPKRIREELWEAAKFLGVDASAIAKAMSKAAEKAVVAKPAAAKKAAPVKVVKGVKSKPAKLSPEAKKRIADAMKKRWAVAKKKAAKKA